MNELLREIRVNTDITMFKPLDVKRYSEQIAHSIQERIIKDEIKMGSRLPTERQLAEDLQVSRSVVREALRMLDVSGYVDIKKGPTGGIFANNTYHKPISASLKNLANHGQITVDHLFDVRLQIEPFMGAEATRNATKEDMGKFHSLFADAALHFDDVSYLKTKNIEFHRLLSEISGNPVLTIFMRSVEEILAEIAYKFLDLSFEHDLYRVHMEIIGLMARKKEKEVMKMLKKDILFVKANLKRSIEMDELWELQSISKDR